MPTCSLCNRTISDPIIWEDIAYCANCFEDKFVVCSGCRSWTDRDAAYFSGSHFYGPACHRQLVVCSYCRGRVPENRTISYDGDHYCRHCYDRVFSTCNECGEIFHRDDLRMDPDENWLCNDCFDINCRSCSDCGRSLWNDDVIYTDDGAYCRRCYNRARRTWDSKPFICEPTYEKIGTRKYGVELETHSCPDHVGLRDDTVWGCKTDCSIEGLEFVSPILQGDQGLAEIKNFCRHARELNWKVNRYCGYHVHFDMTNENWQALRSIAYAYYKTFSLWSRFVSDNRSNNSMCGQPGYGSSDITRITSNEDWDYFVGARDRFEFVNWRAYLVHNTLEVRSHDATLKVSEICKWIKVHASFIDGVKDLSLDEIDMLFLGDIEFQFKSLEMLIGSDLADYYAERAAGYNKPVRLTTAESVV